MGACASAGATATSRARDKLGLTTNLLDLSHSVLGGNTDEPRDNASRNSDNVCIQTRVVWAGILNLLSRNEWHSTKRAGPVHGTSRAIMLSFDTARNLF